MSEEKKGLFQRLREGLTRSRDTLGGRVEQLVTATADFDDEFFEDLTDVLGGQGVRIFVEGDQHGGVSFHAVLSSGSFSSSSTVQP